MRALTPTLLKKIAPAASIASCNKFAPYIDIYSEQYEVNTVLRMSAFLSQILQESGSLKYVRELWGPTIAQQKYEGRKDLGNTQKGDGRRFMGRGLLQITGRYNYEKLSKRLFGDDRLLKYPELLEQPDAAVQSAYLFWQDKGINEKADRILKAKGFDAGLRPVTKAVNGGYTHQAERLEFFKRAYYILQSYYILK